MPGARPMSMGDRIVSRQGLPSSPTERAGRSSRYLAVLIQSAIRMTTFDSIPEEP